MTDLLNSTSSLSPFDATFAPSSQGLGQTQGPGDGDASSNSLEKEIKQLEKMFAAILKALEGDKDQGGAPQAADPSTDDMSGDDGSSDGDPVSAASGGPMGAGGGDPMDGPDDDMDDSMDGGAPDGAGGGMGGDNGPMHPALESMKSAAPAATPAATSPAAPPAAPEAGPGAAQGADGPSSASQATTSAGSGPNDTIIKNTSDHDEKIGEFTNGGSTTTPSAEIDLKPGQTGDLKYQNGQGGFDAEADSSGNFQSTASRLEFYADKNGVNNDDVSDIDGDNAAISVNDGHGRSAGESQSIAGQAPSDLITKDAGGRPTITGFYDGSTQAMKDGGNFMQGALHGTGQVYIHPDDDRNGAGENPMTMAQDSQQTYYATFGNA